jgi:hypothetical protein
MRRDGQMLSQAEIAEALLSGEADALLAEDDD